MTPVTVSSTFEAGKATLDFGRQNTLKLVEDIPTDKLTHQPIADTNHALWVLGHLACTDNFFLTSLGQRETVIDESWNKLFGMGAKPIADPTAYPSLDEIKSGLQRTRDALIDWLGSMDEQQLAAPLPDELIGFAPSFAAVAGSIAWHEGFHAGQLSAIRRSLGLPCVFG